jgi:hypothetical protein
MIFTERVKLAVDNSCRTGLGNEREPRCGGRKEHLGSLDPFVQLSAGLDGQRSSGMR